ncbi:aldehyde dehydrogenase family protein [Calidifontibacillus oryziterrae]|uniref:aldehyde dehydrogenase family protein n=1 Tax=Calidifontibacillus oryziterrae TaxID=1191699 RepID=UPI0002E040E3|nr:aldehyde dehydrogenase family protein [Calidifontibacillus oryziterrae]
MNITEHDIQKIVQAVLQNVEGSLAKTANDDTPKSVRPIKMKTLDPSEHNKSENSGGYLKGNGTNHNGKNKQFPGLVAPVNHCATTTNTSNKGNGQASGSHLDSSTGQFGVFENMDDAIEEGFNAQRNYVKNFQLKDREKIISAIRKAILKEKEYLAKLVFEETKLGVYEDKIAKLELTALKTPGTEDLRTHAISGDDGLTIIEQGPFGLIGGVTPVTNPTETIFNNTIGMIAAGNAVVFNVHPSSKRSCAYAVSLINKTIIEAGGPANLVTMVREPTMETMQRLIDNPKVKILVGTGGPGLVKSLLKSGKKAIGAGAGNPPVIVDETADIEHAAKAIVEGASFDNNLLCIAEKEVFVIDAVADDLIFHMLNNGAYMLSQNELEHVMTFALEENVNKEARGCSLDTKREYHVAKKWVGQSASKFLEKIGVQPSSNVKLLICEVDFDHPFVQVEQLMPVLPIVKVRNLDEAIAMAVEAEHGNRHTALMHSKNVDNLTRFARAVETTIFVKNASSLAGVGFGGEGHTTMTIAGPTGEGITSARTFTRQRRCVLAEGGFRII